jgi:O-antigen biosynthesis protein WbqP
MAERVFAYKRVKRLVDFSVSLAIFSLISPLFVLISILIKLDSKGPVFFRQKRFGCQKIYFDIFKFRTMRVDSPSNVPTHLLESPDEWITRIGRVLRKTSLDELPQLINIVKGEMSLVGPRPALWNQFDLISEREKYGANGVPVGLTGWAQINGRDELPIEVKAKLDGEYVARFGFIMDLRCFLGTFLKVFRGSGVVEGRSTN